MPVTVTLQANALTNLATVLDELTLASDGGAVDSRLNRYINAASDFIERECGRSFSKALAIVENVQGFGLSTLKLSHTPIVALTSIAYQGTTYGAADLAVVDAGAGLVMRRGGFPWTAEKDTELSRRRVPGREFPDIVATYDGGYVTPKQKDDNAALTRTLPSDLEDACVQLVTSRYQGRGVNVRERARRYEATGVTFGGEPVPPEIMAIIAKYARVANA